MTVIIWSPQALLDLESIRDYIAHDSPRYAELVMRRLVMTACDFSDGSSIEAETLFGGPNASGNRVLRDVLLGIHPVGTPSPK